MDYILYFFIYSFLGWLCESIYCSCLQKKIVNRGFLNGPICPVYGVGALIVITGLWSYRDNMVAVFVLGFILTSILEYITATVLEKLFHAKWWDYSNYKFNIHGKVCLLNSTMFGFLSLFVIEVLHPSVINILSRMNSVVLYVFMVLAVATTIVDLTTTVKALNTLTVKVDALANIVEDMKKIHAKLKLYEDEEFIRRLKQGPEEMIEKMKALKVNEVQLQSILDEMDMAFDEKLDEMQLKFKSLKEKSYIHRRLLNAFPNIKSTRSKKRDVHFQYIKKLLKDKKQY
ncbi:MAG: hypothetical protein MR593_07020 [Intestinibacter sp.]|uniref:putative ABC transporter permease n=1 Tax=Intestinibacter sp. TaxID=1965304 RepID=UPI0025BDFB5E|nr:hypothetical protein [Intestinibacter sp.]MCI6737850.1 hypothetical protein [Intestinibacter sp.]